MPALDDHDTETQPETQHQPAAEGEDSQEWSVICLLAEDHIRREYLVQWQDLDPETGLQYPPSWEPKEACTQDLIDEWKIKLVKGDAKRGRHYGQAIVKEFEKKQREELKRRKNATAGKKKGRISGAWSTNNKGRSETPPERDEDDAMEVLDDDEEDEESEESVKKKSKRNGAEKGAERSLRSRDNTTASTASPANGKRKRGKEVDDEDESYRPRSKRTRGKTSTTRGASEASEAVSTNSSALQKRPTRSPKTPSIADTAGQTPIAARVRSRSASVASVPAATKVTKRTAPQGSGSRTGTNGNGHKANAEASGSSAIVPKPKAPASTKTAHFKAPLPTTDREVHSVLSSSPSAPAAARVGRSGAPVIDLSVSIPSRAGLSSKPTDKPSANPTKKLVPVPQPDVSTLQQAKSKQQQEATQSTATQETIRQFSSPLRPEGSAEQRKERQKKRDEAVARDAVRAEKEKDKGKGKETTKLPAGAKKRMIDGEEVVVAPDTDEEAEDGEAAAENNEHEERSGGTAGKQAEVALPPGVVKRIIDGEEVLVAEDSDDDDGDIPAATSAVEVEVAPVATPVPEPVVMVDQSIQVETVEVTTAGTMTDAPTVVPKPAKMIDMAIETVPTTTITVEQVDAEVPNVILDVPPIPVNPTTTSEITSKPVASQILLDLQAQLATAEAEIVDLRSRNASIAADLTFIRAQYDNASSRAVEEVNLNRELTKKLQVKEQQLTVGLQQKELHVAAIQKKDKDHIRAQGIQIKVLLDQARKTDDALRTKAALYPQTKRENEDLVRSNDILEKRVESLTKRNEELVDQVEFLRARQMGVLDGEQSDSASETDTDSTSSSASDDDGGNGQDMAALGYSTRPANMTNSGNIFVPSREPRGNVDYGVKREEIGAETSGQGMAVECQWREEDEDKPCGALLETRTTLQQHWSIHRANVRPIPI